jgi:mRNA-degrading endonuclease YafQ of YafQ-DinJ toxin-antitoxin module
MQRVKDIREASATLWYRLTYQRAGDTILLRRIGTHDVLYEEHG